MTPPTTYTDLKYFAELFTTGVPILTYHKLGPRPPGTRLRGMYISERLFRSQLSELRAAGFTSALPTDAVGVGKRNDQSRIVLSFDDGYVNVLRHGLAALDKFGFKAIQFIVADQIGGHNVWDEIEGEVREPLMSYEDLRSWLAAGHELGSHTLSHARLTEVPVQQAREEITASKKLLEDLFGIPVHHFCYPYGAWNPRVRDWVQEAGYRTASSCEFGVNGAGQDPFVLRRIQTRYRSWGLRGLRERARLMRN